MVVVDDKLWPLLMLRYVGQQEPADFERFLGRMDGVLDRGERYVCVLDTRESQGMSPPLRQRQVEWFKQRDGALRRLCLGSAFLINSPVVRISLSVILVLRPLPVPHTVVATLEHAVEWAADALEADGQPFAAVRARGAFGLLGRPQRGTG